jgi:hypothetical protein
LHQQLTALHHRSQLNLALNDLAADTKAEAVLSVGALHRIIQMPHRSGMVAVTTRTGRTSSVFSTGLEQATNKLNKESAAIARDEDKPECRNLTRLTTGTRQRTREF